jgi:hypothetical protein
MLRPSFSHPFLLRNSRLHGFEPKSGLYDWFWFEPGCLNQKSVRRPTIEMPTPE